jgi:hypothetical protein
VRWADFETGEPELAALARQEFDEHGLVMIGTLRQDGSPRISCVDTCVVDGELYLAMMWRSRKAVDLLRDPRLVLHNPVDRNTPDEVELILRGRAMDVDDAHIRSRFLEVQERGHWESRQFHLFRIDIESAAVVRYGGGEQYVNVWPDGKEFRRPY